MNWWRILPMLPPRWLKTTMRLLNRSVFPPKDMADIAMETEIDWDALLEEAKKRPDALPERWAKRLPEARERFRQRLGPRRHPDEPGREKHE